MKIQFLSLLKGKFANFIYLGGDKSEEGAKRRFYVLAGLTLFGASYGFILNVFKRKYHGYPYSFLIFGWTKNLGNLESLKNSFSQLITKSPVPAAIYDRLFLNQQYYILQLLLLRRGRTWPTQFPDNCRNSDAIIRTTEVTFDLRDFLETKTFFPFLTF